MKRIVYLLRIIAGTVIVSSVIMLSGIRANAQEDFVTDTDELIESLYSESNADELIFSLPDSARDFLGRLYIDDFRPGSTDGMGADTVISAIAYVFRENLTEPLKVLVCIVGIIVLTALFDTLKTSDFSAGLNSTLTLTAAICTAAVLSPPMLSLIGSMFDTISACSDFMLIYVPVISVLIVTSGQAVSGAMFYGIMIYMSSGVLRIVSNVILPLMRCTVSLAVVTNVTDKVSLSGITEMLRKAIRLILTFCMSVFVAFLTMKSIISVSEDSLSNRAVKFAISNFVPLVGGALSDAYQTVVSCVSVLKSGVGVVAMIAIFAIFLPAVAKCLIWQFTLMVSTAVCDVFSNNRLSSLLTSLSSVVSTISAILLCTMVMYIISTAIIIIVGG